ncbi:MAG: hypothetical protein KAX28_10310 [Candidatus Marinimicrobia bacterium]|nr:hypothetical protein [Candidatus Neomarinimicrobiota bacterium]
MMENPDNYVLFDEISSMASALGGTEPFEKLRMKALKAQKSVMLNK